MRAKLFAAVFLNSLGNWAGFFAMTDAAYGMKKSALDVSLMMILNGIGILLGTFYVKYLEKNQVKSERGILATLSTVQGSLLLLSIPIFIMKVSWAAYFLGFLYLFISIFVVPQQAYRTAYVRRAVPKNIWPKYLGLLSTAFRLSMLLGPVCMGFLVSKFGPVTGLLLDSMSFFIAAFFFIKLPENFTRNNSILTKEKENNSKIKNKQYHIKLFLAGSIFVGLSNGAVNTTEFIFIKEVLMGAQYEFGIIITLCGLGGVFGSSLASRYVNASNMEVTECIALGSLFLSYTLFSYSNSLIISCVFISIYGVFSSLNAVSRQLKLNHLSTTSNIISLQAKNTQIILIGNIVGASLSGWLSEITGVRIAGVSGVIPYLLLSLFFLNVMYTRKNFLMKSYS